ncbi:hypothetical protein NMQ14_12940 [Methyloversatilis sp. XJ19-13]|uniref:hypothetical protein n=1 Tax=Methyloversatilis sp. XJ19-13 TaxID=2963430 RepID=UPI00211CFE78|nr:hypothetical protein [Methyloversatilis sp. XJ19-13]MCQ9375158.1 hypothetical protein [Methyloversatilis sp. XJ19-13]
MSVRQARQLVRAGAPIFDDRYMLGSKLAAQQFAPLGWNAYELLYRHLTNYPYNYAGVLQYIKDCGANQARVLYPAFSTAEWTSLVFTSIPPGEISDSDFRPTFLQRTEEVFAAAEAAGVRLYVCMAWNFPAVCALFGETAIQGMSVGSQSFSFVRRLAQWFAKRYAGRPFLGAYSFFNEVVYDKTGASNPTPESIGAVTTALISEMRDAFPLAVASTDFSVVTNNDTTARPTYRSEFEAIATMAAGADVLGLHFYSWSTSVYGQSFVGHAGLSSATFGAGASTNNGFEGVAALLSAARSIAAAYGKRLWITETGVQTEIDAATASLRRRRLIDVCAQYADVTLLWNAADVASPLSNQAIWQVRPGQSLGNTYQALLAAANQGMRSQGPDVGAGTGALKSRHRPRYGMSGARSAGATARVTSVAAMQSATQAVLFWVRKDAALNAFEPLLDFRNSTTAGFLVLAGSDPVTTPEYVDFRGTSGGANTSGVGPLVPTGEWVHIALRRRAVNGQDAIEIWIDGLFWSIRAAANAYAGIPAGTTLYVCGGNSNGAPVSMQDVCIAPAVSPEDIWAHLSGSVLPQAELHLRAGPSGEVVDLSRNRVAVTLGSGVTSGPV